MGSVVVVRMIVGAGPGVITGVNVGMTVDSNLEVAEIVAVGVASDVEPGVDDGCDEISEGEASAAQEVSKTTATNTTAPNDNFVRIEPA